MGTDKTISAEYTTPTIEKIVNGISGISEHDNEMDEFVSKKPPFIVRWGIVLFLLFFILAIIICWVVRYPDVIPANARLTSINAPKEVRTRIDGKLVKLLAVEGLEVSEGQLLGFIESRANPNEVLALSATIDSLQILINYGKTELIPAFFSRPFQHLGEVQLAYQTFIQGFILFRQYLSRGYYQKKKSMLQVDIVYMERLHGYLLEQKMIQLEDLSLADTTFKMNKQLEEEKVIAEREYRDERSKYLGKALSIPQQNTALTNNESSRHEKQKEILQLENEISQQKYFFTQALNTLKSQLDEWKSKYLLVAPIAGKVVFANLLQENQQLQVNQTVCFINPPNSSYFAQILIPQANFGKVVIGQVVLLKFSSYPFLEYGSVEGKIDFISHIPTDSGGYLARVILTNKLLTNYKKEIQYREGLLARAEIITKDLRLLQRFYYSLYQQL